MKDSAFNIHSQSSSIESKIVVSLERISEAFRVLLWREAKEYSLSPLQIQLLIFVAFHKQEKCNVSYLSAEFNMTKATVSDAVKVLLKKELLVKVPNPEDARSFDLVLSAIGRKIADSASVFTKELISPLYQLSDEEKSNLLASVFNIIRHLNKAGIITLQRMCFNCNFYSSSKGHYCNLLKMPLRDTDLRIDCPEHVSAEA